MAERRVLWVTGEVPDASLGGGSIRQAYLLRAVADRAETHLLLAGELRDGALRSRLASVTEVAEAPMVPPMRGLSGRARALRLAVAERRSQEVLDTRATAERLAAALGGVAGRGDIVQIEHTGLAPLASQRRGGERWAITLHTIESTRATQRAAVSASARHRWLYEREAQRARRHETAIARAYDAVWVMSSDDASAFAGECTVVPNGVDVERYAPTPVPSSLGIVFSASLHYFPNIDGATWFCREVMPRVRAQVPGATVTLAGRRPVPAVEELAEEDGVRLLADVADMVPILRSARVAVVPIRVGSGTRLKALEALSAGRPLVGTSVGLAGLGLADGVDAVIADDPASFADGVVRVLQDDAFASELVYAGRRRAQAFSWRRIGETFAAQLLAVDGGER